MKILEKILETLPDGEILDVRVGAHWTAVAARSKHGIQCGLASTLSGAHEHRIEAEVQEAGQLEELSGRQLAQLCLAEHSLSASIGMAALNALLPKVPEAWSEENGEQLIGRLGEGKTVVLVGHFPFVGSLRQRLDRFSVLEQNPQPGDLPAEAATRVIPNADVVAITGMTLANHTLEKLLVLCAPSAKVVVLGPSTPLSPVLFEYGVNILSGAVVMNIETVLKTVSQGGNFRQVHRAGCKLVNMHYTM